jgi:hypothetical protein
VREGPDAGSIPDKRIIRENFGKKISKERRDLESCKKRATAHQPFSLNERIGLYC